jgi:hypothetical protein
MDMSRNIGMRSLLAGAALLIASTGAQAQATRTWVSGTGNDSGNCTRLDPCQSLSIAYTKTAAGGVINAIDAGAFGTVTISKSITIEGAAGSQNGVLASGLTGVTINGVGIVVNLRNLQITGAYSGINGVRYVSGASVTIDNCDIAAFHATNTGSGNGVIVEPTNAGTYRLYISNSRIYDNGWGNDGGGVRVKPTGGSTFVFTTIYNSEIRNNNGYGVLSRDRSFVTIDRSNISGNARSGVNLLTTGSLGETMIRDSLLADNGYQNSPSEASVTSNGAASYINIVGNSIVQSESGLRRLNGGHIYSSGDNRVMGNTANGTTDGSVTSL